MNEKNKNHENVGGAFLDKKVYEEISKTIQCDCEGMTERCLRCRTLDSLRSSADSRRYMSKSVAYICSDRDWMRNYIHEHGDESLIKKMKDKMVENKDNWEALKKQRGW